ncbi:MAG: integrase arm-type DNA-binding domain-containing protein, partial [Rhodospirillaceae bacterium]
MMVRKIGRLTTLTVSRTKEKGLYADGGGLYLQVSSAGTKSWIYRYRMNGRKTPRDMGLGALSTVTLAEARDKARSVRNMVLDGVDPIENKRSERQASALKTASAITFSDCADKYIAAHQAGWRNAKHASQWATTLKTYAYPAFGDLAVGSIDTALVLKAIEPIWATKTETASRVRGRIETILDWATAREYRSGENPARWRGHLDKLLPARKKVQKVKHHEALPYAEVGKFIQNLHEQHSTAAKALEWLILTATRTGETIGARWAEIDFEAKTWTIPAERMKSGKEHRVPLSSQAIKIAKKLNEGKKSDFVFPGGKAKQPLSNNSLLALLNRMDRSDLTAHGFRSTFRDWAAEQTNYAREVAEMALAHTVSDKVEAAYRRGDLFNKRERLMTEWARYCGTVT